MKQMKYLQAKYNRDETSIFNVVSEYITQKRFYEAYSYIKLSNNNELYYKVLSEYLTEKTPTLNNDSTLLITWTIDPKNCPFVFLNDPIKRLHENLMGLTAWIMDKSFDKILIVESSEFKLNTQKLKDIGLEYNKHIEYVSYKGSDNVSIYGKGWGEGESIKRVLDRINTDKFVKMNGKQYIPFFEYDFCDGNKTREYFNLHFIGNKPAVDTRSYCVTKEYYNSYLIDSYLNVNDNLGTYLEHVFYDDVKDPYFLPFEPVMLGKQGSVDRNYGDYPNVVFNLCERIKVEIL